MGWVDDLRYALRRLGRSPGFTVTALVILVLGIGVNTTAFSVVNALLFQPPPFEEPERLVDLLQDADGGGPNSTSYPAYEDIARTEGVFESAAATMVNEGFLEEDGLITPVLIEFATADYMTVLGLAPSRGRWFDLAEDVAIGPPAAVLTYRTWRDRMGSDPDVLGKTVRVGGSNVMIVGVGPGGVQRWSRARGRRHVDVDLGDRPDGGPRAVALSSPGPSLRREGAAPPRCLGRTGQGSDEPARRRPGSYVSGGQRESRAAHDSGARHPHPPGARRGAGAGRGPGDGGRRPGASDRHAQPREPASGS